MLLNFIIFQKSNCSFLCFVVITLEFEQVVCTVSEADGTAELVITKNGLSSDAISVLFSTMNGNASGIVS